MHPEQPIWITGANGLIGNYLVQSAPTHAPGQKIIGLKRDQFDLTDFPAVRRAFREQNPRLIIHCAAMSKSLLCQSNPALARKVNVDVTALLAELAAEIPFLFFSSDLVFDGRAGNYVESAPVNPLSIYGETKVAAEKIVLANPRYTVIRTSLNAGVSPRGCDCKTCRVPQGGSHPLHSRSSGIDSQCFTARTG
jgi:dTDP-4-dehydrorhamnose reductase